MNVKLARRLISKKLKSLIEQLEAVAADVSTWEPGEANGWLSDELSDALDKLTDICDGVDESSYSSDEDEDEDNIDEDVDDEDDFDSFNEMIDED